MNRKQIIALKNVPPFENGQIEFEFNPKLTIIWGRTNSGKTRILKEIYNRTIKNPNLTNESDPGQADFRDALLYLEQDRDSFRSIPSITPAYAWSAGNVSVGWKIFSELFDVILGTLSEGKISARVKKKINREQDRWTLSVLYEKTDIGYEELMRVIGVEDNSPLSISENRAGLILNDLWSSRTGSTNERLIWLAYDLAIHLTRMSIKNGAKNKEEALKSPAVAFIDDLDSYDACFYNRRANIVSNLCGALPGLCLIATVRNYKYLADQNVDPHVILIQQAGLSNTQIYSSSLVVRTIRRFGSRLMDYPRRKDYFTILATLDDLSVAEFNGRTGEEVVSSFIDGMDYLDYHRQERPMVTLVSIGNKVTVGRGLDGAIEKRDE